MSLVALSELLGAPVRDPSGAAAGRVREVAVTPQDHPTRIAFLIVRTPRGERAVPADQLRSCRATVRINSSQSTWEPYAPSDGVLLLKRDLLDQQIIDVHGRKVVRVNDVELESTPINDHVHLDVVSVNVGARGAIRRLGKGIIPARTLRKLLEKVPPNVIPWQFVNLLETDPARRVKLKISYDGLSQLHPADIADIIEDLAPAEQKSVIEAMDEEVAAGALEEIEPDVQRSILESLDKDRAADIMEEMGPDAAADLLGDMTEERSGEILEEMQPEERRDVTHLLEFEEHTAAGRMTTEYLALPGEATPDDAIEAIRGFEGGYEALATIFLIDPTRKLTGAVPLARIATSPAATPLSALAVERLVSCPADATEDDVAELFDKYNLITLPVVDEHGRLAGIITADDVISLLRNRG